MARSVSDANAFANAAVRGQIGIEPDAAQAVLKKIRNGKDQVETLITRADGLGAPPKLGANAVGTAMAKKFSQRANGGNDSYVQALRNLHTQYQQVEKALVLAIKNYEENEAVGVETFTRKV